MAVKLLFALMMAGCWEHRSWAMTGRQADRCAGYRYWAGMTIFDLQELELAYALLFISERSVNMTA
jgi:nitric oxide synthase oxygenase domain/subunit